MKKKAVSVNTRAMLKENTKKRRRRVGLISLGGAVAAATLCILIRPAFAQANDAFCGLEEHTHSDRCYTEEMVLVCDYRDGEVPSVEEKILVCPLEETSGHTHTDSCYAESRTLTCGQEECEAHTHSEACYTTMQNLVCGNTDPEHVHEDTCYETWQELTCGQTEREGHAHTDECYTASRELICGQEERPAHVHSDACYETHITGGHVHTDECYAVELVLTCGKEEHTHTLQCFSNPDADVETSVNWAASMQNVRLSTVWADDVIAVAQSQLGYTESTLNYLVRDDGTLQGYTRYGAWYGDAYGDWCAMFCSFCLRHAGVTREAMPIEGNCQDWIELLSEEDCNLYVSHEDGIFEPRVGDLIFFDLDYFDPYNEFGEKNSFEGRDADHVGFVTNVLRDEATGAIEKLQTIEGNNGPTVTYCEYEWTDSTILGFGLIPVNPNESKEPIEGEVVEEPAFTEEELITEEETVTDEEISEVPEETASRFVTIESAPASDGAVAVVTGILPEGATVTIEAVVLSQEELAAYLGAEQAALIGQYTAYDITIYDAEGVEWQPNDSVTVTVRQPSITVENQSSVGVAHVDASGEVSEVEVSVGESGEVEFEADGFSLYIIYSFTVDFHYGDIDFSMTGKTNMLLSELFAELGIQVNVAQVANVTFTDDSLLTVMPMYGEEGEIVDWVLSSLQAFSTEETLTVTSVDGSVLTIRVTDAAESGTTGTTYWQLVTDGVDQSSTYILVSTVNTEKMLQYGTSTTATAPSLTLVRDNIYSTDDSVPTAAMFQFTGALGNSGGTTGLKTKEGTHYLNLGSKNFFSSDLRNLLLSRNSTTTDEDWMLQRTDNGNWLRLNDTKTTFQASTTASYRTFFIYKQLDKLPLEGITKSGSNDNTSYSVPIYALPVDQWGNPTGEDAELMQKLVVDNSHGSGNPFKPADLFAGYVSAGKVSGSFVSAYYGKETYAVDGVDNITSIYRGGSHSSYSLRIKYGSNGDKQITSSVDNAIFLRYRPGTTPEDPGTDPGTNPGTNPGGDITKPTYAAYITPSGAKTGETSLGKVSGTYSSDPATSQLENNAYFNDRTADNGKLLTDKSVIYGADDYGAFSEYPANTFGVTLSALAQQFSLTDELEVTPPLDVVFILDTSGSMIETKNASGASSASVMIKALNSTMASVLASNDDNRVGVVCFSGGSQRLLDLGRYTANDNKYFTEKDFTSITDTITMAKSLRRTDGTLVTRTYDKGWYGTYTQRGIAEGAKIFLDNNDTYITKTLSKETADGTISATVTMKRRPVFILLSDGEPTYCTEDYSSVLTTTNVHGQGGTGYYTNGNKVEESSNNNKGVHGYYTILSANSYKNAVTSHYNNGAYFYTVGLGINKTGTNSLGQSVAGDDYKRAVLNPTGANVNALQNCTNGTSYVTPTAPVYVNGNIRDPFYDDISGCSDYTCHMLYKLLNTTTYVGKNIYVGDSVKQYGLDRATTNKVPVSSSNPYAATGYKYTDGAVFMEEATESGLITAFTDALKVPQNIPVYGFILRQATDLVMSDAIGAGMEVKGEPVLRYGGANYSPVSSSEKDGVTTYTYSGTYEAEDGSGTKVDMSLITAAVATDATTGRQTVTLRVTDDAVPAYKPYLNEEGTTKFYYESLPVRLIYQVGLTAESEADVAALAGTSGHLMFYTNEWTNGATEASFKPTAKNPYYMNDTYSKDPTAKSENTTDTKSDAWAYTADCDNEEVTEVLGNNGKLYFQGTITPPDPKEKAPDNYKRIDAFRDGVDNPDTTLDNDSSVDLTDLYRLYLDVGPESSLDSVDVLFVVDRSSSMDRKTSSEDATDILGAKNVRRQYAMNSMLNGLSVAGTNNNTQLLSNGLISSILSLNPKNKVAVTAFNYTSHDDVQWISAGETGRKYTNSATYWGTNYVAALRGAEQYLKAVEDDGNKKIVIFCSDGVPTCFHKGSVFDTTDTTVWSVYSSGMVGSSYPDAVAAIKGHQDGTGSENDAYNPNSSIYKCTMAACKDFHDAHPDVDIFCVGIGSYNEKFMEALTNVNNGQVCSVSGNDFKKIMSMIDDNITHGVGRYSNLVIRDELSDYVDFQRPLDLKVTMTPKDGEPDDAIVLYTNGQLSKDGKTYVPGSVTTAGAGIIKSVTVNPATKEVVVTFEPDYKEEGNYRYSVSFNVHATQQAYDEYAANFIENDGKGYVDENGDVIRGDIGTDYYYNVGGLKMMNTTSSDQPGFHSNAEATLTYTQTYADGTSRTGEKPFPDPVIQVSTTSVPVNKVWDDEILADDHSPITVKLYAQLTEEDEKTYIASGVLQKGHGQPGDEDYIPSWSYVFENLPKHFIAENIHYDQYIYTVEEEVPTRYEATYTVNSDGSITITNEPTSFTLNVRKLSEADNTVHLSGAQFELYRNGKKLTFDNGAASGEYIYAGTSGGETQILVTNASGEFSVTKLPEGTYKLKETKAPPGYLLAEEEREFLLKFTSTSTGSETLSLDVEDPLGSYVLPATGGAGEKLFYVLGIILTAGAMTAYGIRLNKKKKANK